MNNMTNGISDNRANEALIKVLTSHYHSLVAAKSEETILGQYARLLRSLKSRPTCLLEGHDSVKGERPSRSCSPSAIDEVALRKASLDDIEKIVIDDKTPRKDLEFIAIHRFSVPRGSMRSFSSKQMLVDKLCSLIGNERAHKTIGEIARGEERRP